MTPTTHNTVTITLREDVKDISFQHLASSQFTGLSTYITYFSESHPHKHCVYVLYGKYIQIPDTNVTNGKIQLIEMF